MKKEKREELQKRIKKMEEERGETLHMFDDEVKRVKAHAYPVPAWYLQEN